MQAMQLASNLIQAIDESPRTAYYTRTENMSWFDQSSRKNQEFLDKMNKDLEKLGLATSSYWDLNVKI